MTLEKLNEIKEKYKVLEIAVDFINPSYNISRVKHLDTARYIVCTLTENGVPRFVSESETARIRLQKPDRTYVYNDCDILEDGRVFITLTEQMLAAEGNSVCDIQLADTQSEIIYSTQNFIITVDKTAVDNSVMESANEFGALNSLILSNQKLNDELTANEQLRQSGETSRIANENSRKNNETARAGAESMRAAAEASRISNEDARVLSETARNQNEAIRQDQESERQTSAAAAVADAETAAAKAGAAADSLQQKLDAHHFVLSTDKGAAGGVAALDANSKIPANELYDATISEKGVTLLTDSIISDSVTTAATANSVKTAYEESKSYTDSKIADLIGSGGPGTTDISAELAKKVDKEDGMGLSSNDYTDTEKTKLSGIADGATYNKASSTTPKAAGTAAAGTEKNFARGDHVHPAQTDITGNAGTATKLATARNINGISFDGSANRTNFAVCSTAAATAAKTVSCTGFTLITGAEITVFFNTTNTAANPTLNVNNTGAKPIFYRGAAISAGYLAANRIYTFRYTGSAYSLVGDINTNTTYSNMTGATASAAGKAGLVPAPAADKYASFLRGDGIWFNPFAAINVTTTAKNANSFSVPGVFYFAQDYTPINAPTGVVNGYLIVIAVTTTNIKQIWLRHGTVNSNDHEIYIRSYNGTNWSSWAKCITSKDAASLTVCYQGSFNSGTVTKALPSGKTKCLIIASKATTTHGLECGAHVLTGLSGSMTAVNHKALWSSPNFTMLCSISTAGAITLETSADYTMIYFA